METCIHSLQNDSVNFIFVQCKDSFNKICSLLSLEDIVFDHYESETGRRENTKIINKQLLESPPVALNAKPKETLELLQLCPSVYCRNDSSCRLASSIQMVEFSQHL